MKMNRFNVNSHPAFFDVDRFGGDRSPEKKISPEIQIDELKTEMYQVFEENTTNFLAEINSNQEQTILSGYTMGNSYGEGTINMAQLTSDHRRFMERFYSKSVKDGNKVYSDIWNGRITDGFGHLVTALEEASFFEGKDKITEIAKIKDQYWNEVKQQYIDSVWFAGNKKFDREKDTLFGRESANYPANKIYCELTGAATIFKIDRQYMEGYNPDIIVSPDIQKPDAGEQSEDAETMSDRQNRNFLSDDLPMYLWDIKKSAPDRLNWIPLITARIDKPSKEDRKAINKFIKVSSRLKLQGNSKKDKVLALLEVLHDNSLNINSGEGAYNAALRRHGLEVDDKYLDDIVEVGNFYIRTQSASNAVRDQHAIYLSVLSIIENEGGVEKTVDKFKSIVEQAKKDRKTERKQGYESGEQLEDGDKLKILAEKLEISDFTGVTRLSKKDSEYFTNTPTEKILANINNDNIIDARDTIAGGSKTGNQFLEVFNQIGKDKALPNLLAHAKLVNKTLGLGIEESKFTEAEIKSGNNKELILLLQNIISKPGEDLYTLLSGHEGLNSLNEMVSADAAAAEMVSKMNMDALRGLGLQVPENMQAGLSMALYEAYHASVWSAGLGGQVSFDQWVKGLSLNTGVQVDEDGNMVVGLGIDYVKKFDLGRGWSTTADVSSGVFIPLCKKPVTAAVGVNLEIAKEWVTNNGVQAKLGLQTGASVSILQGTLTLSAGFIWERDKSAGIEYREQELKGQMNEKMNETLSNIRTRLGTKKLDFNDSEVTDIVKGELRSMTTSLGIDTGDVDRVVNATLRLLLNYNGADLSQDGVIRVIAQGVAEQYSMAWAEARRAKIVERAYVASANLGAYLTIGTKFVGGVYLGMTVKKHRLDGYGDRWGREQEIAGENIAEWNDEALDSRINQPLGLSGAEKLKIESGFVVIPQSVAHRVNVNPNMKTLMKKDNNGNILLNKQTLIAIDVRRGAATQGSEIIIGGNNLEQGQNFQKLDILGADWFTSGDINQDEVLNLGEGDRFYTAEVVNRALGDLKAKFPEGDKIQDFNFNNNMDAILQGLRDINTTKKGKIIIKEDDSGILVAEVKEGSTGRGLEIEYQAKFEMMNPEAERIAEIVYEKALRVTNPRVLNAVKHTPRSEWTALENAFNTLVTVGSGANNVNENGARQAVRSIFAKLDTQINGADFSGVLDNTFDNLRGDALVQVLMSIKNIFARSKQVRGGSENYEFKRPNGREKEMAAIIKERYSILNTLQGKVDDDQAKERYRNLFDATRDYVNGNQGFKITSAQAKSLGNTVGFNLGDKTNPENPLFNPEIYDPMVDLDGLDSQTFSQDARNGLHVRAMKLFAKKPALVNPVLKAMGIDTSILNLQNLVDGGNITINPTTKKCELRLDIGGKKYILSSGMKFGFFTQCVNHTIILNNITIESQDGASVTFNSGVWEGGNYVEGNKTSIISTTQLGANLNFGLSDVGGSGDGNSEVKTSDATTGGVSPTTTTSNSTQVQTGHTGAGQGNGGKIGGGKPV